MSHPDFSGVLRTAFDELSRAMRNHDPSFVFHQITLNYNVQCRAHKDRGNEGPSYIAGFGRYEGGNLVLWDEDDDEGAQKDGKEHMIRHRFVKFNGKTQLHETAPFYGREMLNKGDGKGGSGGGSVRRRREPPERITAVFYSAGPDGKWLNNKNSTAPPLTLTATTSNSSTPSSSTSTSSTSAATTTTTTSTRSSISTAAKKRQTADSHHHHHDNDTLTGKNTVMTPAQREAVLSDRCTPLAIVAGGEKKEAEEKEEAWFF